MSVKNGGWLRRAEELYHCLATLDMSGATPRLVRDDSLFADVEGRDYSNHPDGKRFAFIHRDGGRYQVAMQDLSSGQMQILTDSAQDESPSFAPNGMLIVYATVINGRGVLATVSVDGKTRTRLSDRAGDMREPAWEP